MPSLVLGPLLRHAGETDATVWVETDARCTVEVLGHTAETFCVGGRHYGLVHVQGLGRDSSTPYEVLLDGRLVWPLADSDWPPSVIRTTARDRPVDIVFGSCRVAYPHEPPYTLTKDQDSRGREVDALRAIAHRMRELPPHQWPGALLMLGDQIYADEVDPATTEFIRGRRDPAVPPGETLAGFHEYAHAYGVSWSDTPMRWLLSTVPSAMIFDDHDVIDDWNTSRTWLTRMRGCGWWDERIVGAFTSYWVYQHIGNLSPSDLSDDHHYGAVCSAEDGEDILREFGFRADRAVDSTQWSFCRDIGPARLIMVDTRGGRLLDPGGRHMVDEDEWSFIERNGASAHHDHVLIGASLPWLLAPAMHHLEAWNEAICDGAWGSAGARLGERLREGLDLEHWAAFGDSFRRLASGDGRRALRRRAPRVPRRGRVPALRRRPIPRLPGRLLSVPQPARQPRAAGDQGDVHAAGGRPDACAGACGGRAGAADPLANPGAARVRQRRRYAQSRRPRGIDTDRARTPARPGRRLAGGGVHAPPLTEVGHGSAPGAIVRLHNGTSPPHRRRAPPRSKVGSAGVSRVL
jgi:hypothetical protein